MGIPSDPSVSDIVTEGLKRGGRVNPSAGDITNFTNIHFQEVKSDIYLKAPRHFTMESVMMIPLNVGQTRYNWPTNCEAIKSVQIVDAPTSGSWVALAQAGGANTITLNASFTANSGDIVGRFVFILTGTGNGQFAQIIAYNDSTKVATIESNWSTLNSTWVNPANDSTYLIENIRYKAWEWDKPHDWDTLAAPFQQMTPTHVTMMDRQIWLDSTPSRQYAMPVTFWYALDQLDETSSLFTAHLRKFRNIWTQGIAVKVCQRFDEDRYAHEINIYNAMLDMYGSSAASVGQVIFRDVP